MFLSLVRWWRLAKTAAIHPISSFIADKITLGAGTPAQLIDRRFIGNLGFGLIAQVLTALTGFFCVTLITRFGGISVYGHLSLLVAISGFLAAAIGVRSNDAIVRFYSLGRAQNDAPLCKTVILLSSLIELPIAIILFLLLFLASQTIATHIMHDLDTQGAVRLYAIVAFAGFLRGSPYGLLIAKERFRLVNALSLCEQIIRLTILATFVIVFGSITIYDAITATLASTCIITAFYIFYTAHHYFFSLRTVPVRWFLFRDFGRFTVSAFLSSTIKLGGQGVDTIVTGALLGSAAVGMYNLFKQFLIPISMLSSPLATQIAPRFVTAVGTRSYTDIALTLRTVYPRLALLSLGIIFFLTPALIAYCNWNNLALSRVHYIAFAIMVVGSCLQLFLWWARGFAIAIDINLSFASNAIYTFAILLLIYPLVTLADVAGAGLSVTLSLVVVSAYWRVVLNRVCGNTECNISIDEHKH